ncbi:MAG: hypothetical protein JXR37_25445 [Kiritimatiellae bacterium]|nr:hypothetical protein [Kiritimatiellia bacterium]
MRRIAATAFLCVACGAARGEILRFDFGPEKGPVAGGFTQVTPAAQYTAERGWGFAKKGQSAEDTNRDWTVLQLDDLCCDRVDHPRAFKIDLPPGEYEIYILSGACRKLNRAKSEVYNRWVKIDGQKVVEEKRDFASFFAPDGVYFKSYHTFLRPGQSLWQRYMAHHFPVYRFRTTVAKSLELTFSDHFSLNAMVIHRAGDPEGRAFCAELDRKRQEWFDSYYVHTPRKTPEPALPATAEQKQGGLVLFSRHFMDRVYPNTVPGEEEIERPVKLFGALGERVTAQVGFLPLNELGAVDVAVGDLNGPGRIGRDRIRLEYCRYLERLGRDKKHYSVSPAFLSRQVRVPGDAHITRAFYLTVHIPENAPSGIYAGKVAFRSGNGLVKTLPVQVRVLDLRLPPPDRYFGMYHGAPDSLVFRAYNFQKNIPQSAYETVCMNQYDLMQELGFNTVSISLPWGPIKIDKETGKPAFSEEQWQRWVYHFDAIRDRGFKVASEFGMGWTSFMNNCPHFFHRTRVEKTAVEEIRFKEEAKQPAAAMLKLFYDTAKARNWPEIYLYMADELGNEGVRGAHYGRELARFLQEIKPMVGYPYKVFYSSLSAQIAEPMLPYLDIVCPNSAFPLNGKTLDLVRAKGPDLWIYNAGGSRMSYGYYLQLVGAKGRLQWNFTWGGAAPDLLFGFANSGGSIDTAFDPDWNVLPTQTLYNYRAGIDDLRYLALLRAKLARNPAHRAAGEAQAVLGELQSRLSRDFLDPTNSWQPSTYDYFRWRIAKAILGFAD